MNTTRNHRKIGLALLNAMAWVRRQPWLATMFSMIPASWKNLVSARVRASAYRNTSFVRSERWASAVLATRPAANSNSLIVGKSWRGGVNIHAFAKGQFGLGENARLYARALIAAGYPVALNDIALDVPHEQDDRSLDAHIGTSAPYSLDLVFVNPDHFCDAIKHIRPAQSTCRYTIGYWFWELERFPSAWVSSLDEVDEVMVASEFVRKAVQSVTEKPVFKVAVPMGDIEDSGLERPDFGLDEDVFVFLCTFDFHSSLERKNPLGSIAAFQRAFPSRKEKVRLLLKSSNGRKHPEKLRELMNAIHGDPRILVRDDIIDRKHLHALQRCCDCYISLHRSEGLGLGLAECMRLGKPVIGTGYSGNLEFMTQQNSYLVDYKLLPVPPDAYIHAENQSWAEPDLDHAAEMMRAVVAEPALANAKGRKAAEDIRQQFSVDTCMIVLTDHLEDIHLRHSRASSTPLGCP